MQPQMISLPVEDVEFLLSASSHRMPDGLSAQQALAFVGRLDRIAKAAQAHIAAAQQKPAEPKAEQQPSAGPTAESLAAAKQKMTPDSFNSHTD